MPELPSQTLMAELCYLAPPALSAADLLAGMRVRRPDAQLVDGERGRDPGQLPRRPRRVPGEPVRSAGHRRHHRRRRPARAGPDATPRWAGAAEALSRCRYSLLVTEFVHREVDVRVRLSAFAGALRAMVELTRPLATWWPASQQAVQPEVAAADPIRGAVNIRHFPDPADDEVAVLDTLGLAQLGLPDLQCHYRHLNTELLADRFARTAREMADGASPPAAAIRGITVHQRWPVCAAPALHGPARSALTVDPGAPFAVQERTRRGTDSRHQAYD